MTKRVNKKMIIDSCNHCPLFQEPVDVHYLGRFGCGHPDNGRTYQVQGYEDSITPLPHDLVIPIPDECPLDDDDKSSSTIDDYTPFTG